MNVQPPEKLTAADAGMELELTRFRGHLILSKGGIHDAQVPCAVPGGVSPADGRAGACRSFAHRALRGFDCSDQTIRNWVAQSAIASGKPLPGKEGLTTGEREELTRLRRRVRQLQMERVILAKATASFAGKNGGGADVLFELVAANQADFPIRTMCRKLQVSPSGFYACMSARRRGGQWTMPC
jgi:transposase-like protein